MQRKDYSSLASTERSRVELLREAWRAPDLRTLLGAQFLSQFADGFHLAVFTSILVLDPLEGSTPGRILRLAALTLVPYSFIAPFLGVFVDRWKRRSILVGANLCRTAILLALPVVDLAIGGDTALYAGALALLGLGRLWLTTKGALLPVVLEEHNLLKGNSLSSGGGMVCALLGGMVGVFIEDPLGSNSAFVFAGAVYAAGAFVASRLSRPFEHPHARTEALTSAVARVTGELVEGLHEIWVRERARLPLVGIFILRTIGMFVAISSILIIQIEFPGAGDDFGRVSASAVALGAAGIGAFAGALTAPLWGRRLAKPGLIVAGCALNGLGIVLLGGIALIPAMLALTFVGGYGGFIAKVAVDAQLQEALPDEYRGRAFALYDILYNLATVAAGSMMVIATDVTISGAELRPAMVSAGLGAIVLGLALASAMQRAGMALRL